MLYEKNKKSFLFKFFSISSVITIILLSVYQFDVSIRNNPYNISMFLNQNLKYQDNVVKSLNPRSEWDKFISNDLKYLLNPKKKDNRNKALKITENYFEKKDIDNINRLMKSYGKTILIHNMRRFTLTALIKYGHVVQFDNNKLEDYLINNLHNKKVCFLIYKKDISLSKTMNLKFSNSKGLNLYCNFKKS